MSDLEFLKAQRGTPAFSGGARKATLEMIIGMLENRQMESEPEPEIHPDLLEAMKEGEE